LGQEGEEEEEKEEKGEVLGLVEMLMEEEEGRTWEKGRRFARRYQR